MYHEDISACRRYVAALGAPDTTTPWRMLEDAREDLAEQRKWLKRLPKMFIGSAATIGAGFTTAGTVGGPLVVGGVAAGVGGIASIIVSIVLAAINLDSDTPTLRRKVRNAQHEYDDALAAKMAWDAREPDVRKAKDAA